jgi:ribosome-associated protein
VTPSARSTRRPAAPRPVPVWFPITLGQFLKVAQVASSGGEAKRLITLGLVQINGETEKHRGRKLVPGDLVEVETTAVRVAEAGGAATPPPSGRAPGASIPAGPPDVVESHAD